MKLALIGHGNMGKLIHKLAEEKGDEIVAIIDSKNPLRTKSNSSISLADVCIDFSTPQTVLQNVKFLASLKKDIIMGTTGWDDDHLLKIKQIIAESKTGFLYSPNFSIGIALFLKIIDHAAKLMTSYTFSESNPYEVAGIEMHHSKKLDSPSGTANAIANQLNQYHSPPVVFSSVRVGSIPGTHSIIYDSPVDSITLTHTARNREGFAEGALTAAQWIIGKKGVFTLDDMLVHCKD